MVIVTSRNVLAGISMNILIISTNRNKHPVPVMPIGACMVAEAAESAGHRVAFVDLMFEKDPLAAVLSAVERSRPEIVGVSVRNIDNNDMKEPVFFVHELLPLVDAVRKATDARLVLGGAALSVMPEELLRAAGVPLGVLGDGEVAFPMLLDRLSRRMSYEDVPGIASLENGTFRKVPCMPSEPSEGFPVPDYRRWLNVAAYRLHLSTVPVQTKLGCQFQCVYCTYRKIEGSTYRLSAPEGVADAVAQLAAAGLRDVEFVDSVFNAPYDHALSVCESLSRVDHKARLQSIELNPAFFDGPLLAAMERAGFVGIGMTVESASDRVLQGLRKGFSAREVHRAAEALRRRRLPCAWIFLLGGPGETAETVRETLRFAERSVRPRDAAFFNIGIRIYPGTELESIAREQGLLSLPAAGMLPPVFYVSPEVRADRIVQEIKKAMAGHMNFISSDSINFSSLPAIHRLGYRLGLRSPLWRYTRFIRRGLRFAGMDV
jgi:radical SAM superfamily enzyme YgiQ (UPF0313 family)